MQNQSLPTDRVSGTINSTLHLGKDGLNQYAMHLCAAIESPLTVVSTLNPPLHWILSGIVLLSWASAPVRGAENDTDQWRLCGPFQLVGSVVPPKSEEEVDRQGAPTVIQADRAESTDTLSHLQGNVRLERADQQLESDELYYDSENAAVSTPSGLFYSAGGVAISARKAQINMDQDTGTMEEVRFANREQHAYVAAKKLELQGPKLTHLTDFTYATCNPGEEAWRLRGSEIKLDENEGFGTAYYTRIELGGLPIFYLPYLKFPITDERLTGFLMPTLGSSSERGTEIEAPYYINLDPQYDLTLTPKIMSKRGFALGSELRYLTDNSNGNLALDWLPDDDEFNGEDRGLLIYKHNSQWKSGWQALAAIEHTTDEEYLEDFSDTLSSSSTTHLERLIDLSYHGSTWNFRGRLQGYQTVDDTIADIDTLYRRVPQLTLDLHEPADWSGGKIALASEWVRFDHKVDERGDRFDLQPSLSYPMEKPWGFLRPKLTTRYTDYSLSNRSPGLATEIDRALHTFSLDGGLFFERPVTVGTRSFTQTLEPRIFYLNTPFKDQSDIPVFDTTEPDFGFAGLFRENRFSGTDRIGDADQISVALTTRLLDEETGKEQLRAGIGQIHYFEDRQVQLPGNSVATRDHSDIVGELAVDLPRHWNLNLTTQWDPDIDRGVKNALRLQYRPSNQRIFNVGYRFQRDELEQTDLSFRWPLGAKWHGVGRWNYSLRNERDLETFIGVEYESCCWAMRVVGRRFLNDDDGTYSSSVKLQLVLKGLARFGDGIESVLERGILGYEQDF